MVLFYVMIFYLWCYIVRRKIIWNIRRHFDLYYFIRNLTGVKPLCITLNQIDGFIKIYYRIRYLVLFDYGRFDKISDMSKYVISEKGATDGINHNFGRIRIDSYNYLSIEEILNKNEYYYYNIFLEKGLFV